MMRSRLSAIFTAIPVVAGLALSAPAAHAQWRPGFYGPRFYGPRFYRPGPVGAVVGGALLGFGVGALLAPPLYRPPPPVVYAPPPPYYPPYYAPAPYYYRPY